MARKRKVRLAGAGLGSVFFLCVCLAGLTALPKSARVTPTLTRTPRSVTVATASFPPAASALEPIELTATTESVRISVLTTSGPTEIPTEPLTQVTEAPVLEIVSGDTPEASPTDVPILCVAAKNANLRAGPGTNYPKVGGVTADQLLDVVGRNEAQDWYQLRDGNWIAAFLVSNAPAVPVVADVPPPPPPTDTPIPLPTLEPTAVPVVVPTAAPPPPQQPARSCCKICTTGKACGNSCISRNKTCHQPAGCACNG